MKQVVFMLATIVLLMATGSYAAPAFRTNTAQGEIVLRLSDDKCSNEKVVAHLKGKVRPEYQNEFRASTLDWFDGKRYQSCWIALEGMVYSIDEEGSPLNPVPYRAFAEEGV